MRIRQGYIYILLLLAAGLPWGCSAPKNLPAQNSTATHADSPAIDAKITDSLTAEANISDSLATDANISDSLARAELARLADMGSADTNEALPLEDLFLPDTFSTALKPLIRESSALEGSLKYLAADSIYLNTNASIARLYREARVDYTGMSLEADYMEINLPESEVFALPTVDSLGFEIGVPHFQDKKDAFDAKEIRYNFKTKRGLIRDVRTQQDEIYVHGKMVKKYENDVSFIQRAAFTSCDLEKPHFEVRAFRAKVIPDKAIAMGSAMLFIEDIPTPLVIPFAYVPDMKKRVSGFIMPTFGQTMRAGFFFKGLGFYLKVNDYFDVKLTGDVYTSGNWEAELNMRYALRYKFAGSLGFAYSWLLEGERGLPHRPHQTGFKVQWSHRQDNKAHPHSNFSAYVNYTNSSFSKVSGSLSDYLTNTTSSNITYSLDFARKLHLNINANADYNTTTNILNIGLPSLSLSVDQLYPFRRRKTVGKRRWYENISFNYNFGLQNKITAADTALFTRETLQNMQNGIKQTIRLANNIKILKYISWSNTIDYNEYWYLKNTLQHYDAESQSVVKEDAVGFKTTRYFQYSTSFYFNLYATFRFKRGWVKAFRHVMTPSVGFTYHPDFSKPFWGTYDTYIGPNGNPVLYSKFANNLYGGPPSGTVGSLNLSLKNSFEMKVRSKKDTVNNEKKVKLIDNLTISTSYNIAADSLRWAPLTLSARTVLFQRLNVNVGAAFDFYKADAAGNRYNEFFWVNNKQKGLRWQRTNLAVSLGWNLNPKARPKENQAENAATIQDRYFANDIYTPTDIFFQPIDFKAPWNLNIGYNLNYITQPDFTNNGAMKHSVIQTVTLSGNVKLTPKFTVNFGTGFDIMSKKFTVTSITFSRDLHCWEMGFYWVPFGYRTEWNFHIRVKSSIFQSLKYEKRKDYLDNYY